LGRSPWALAALKLPLLGGVGLLSNQDHCGDALKIRPERRNKLMPRSSSSVCLLTGAAGCRCAEL
jgi:hypothetical protein